MLFPWTSNPPKVPGYYVWKSNHNNTQRLCRFDSNMKDEGDCRLNPDGGGLWIGPLSLQTSEDISFSDFPEHIEEQINILKSKYTDVLINNNCVTFKLGNISYSYGNTDVHLTNPMVVLKFSDFYHYCNEIQIIHKPLDIFDNQVFHPHVSDGCICWGNLDEIIGYHARCNNLEALAEIIQSFLSTCNPGHGFNRR